MILLDFSQVAISNLHQQLKKESDTLEPDLLRHMILTSIRKAKKEFGNVYGRMVLCADNSNYWRKSFFPFYKDHRKKKRTDSGIDWPLVYQTLDQLKDELRDNFPYKVMDVHMAEADDVIGVLAKNFHASEKVLILSGDKDFIQLQQYPDVAQYAPTRDMFLTTDTLKKEWVSRGSTPSNFLLEHIMRGDDGDGIPNFLSPDNSFVDKIKQASIFKAKVTVWLGQQPEEFCDEATLANYKRNQTLVDLSKIPAEVETAILDEFALPPVGSKDRIYQYLVKNRMAGLLTSIREF